MRELEALIRDVDREIRARTFEQTFEATAKNFEEMVEHLFPGGRGRLRRVSLHPVRDAEEHPAEAEGVVEAEERGGRAEEREVLGVEIEVTPAGKSTRKLSLLSAGRSRSSPSLSSSPSSSPAPVPSTSLTRSRQPSTTPTSTASCN